MKDYVDHHKGKTVLIVGTWVSALDILEILLREPEIKLIVSGNIGPLSLTTDFKSNIESGQLKLKTGKKHKLSPSTIEFEDETSEEVDSIIFATGFK